MAFSGRGRVLAHQAVSQSSNQECRNEVRCSYVWQNCERAVRTIVNTHRPAVAAKFALNCQLPSGKHLVI